MPCKLGVILSSCCTWHFPCNFLDHFFFLQTVACSLLLFPLLHSLIPTSLPLLIRRQVRQLWPFAYLCAYLAGKCQRCASSSPAASSLAKPSQGRQAGSIMANTPLPTKPLPFINSCGFCATLPFPPIPLSFSLFSTPSQCRLSIQPPPLLAFLLRFVVAAVKVGNALANMKELSAGRGEGRVRRGKAMRQLEVISNYGKYSPSSLRL